MCVWRSAFVGQVFVLEAWGTKAKDPHMFLNSLFWRSVFCWPSVFWRPGVPRPNNHTFPLHVFVWRGVFVCQVFAGGLGYHGQETTHVLETRFFGEVFLWPSAFLEAWCTMAKKPHMFLKRACVAKCFCWPRACWRPVVPRPNKLTFP